MCAQVIKQITGIIRSKRESPKEQVPWALSVAAETRTTYVQRPEPGQRRSTVWASAGRFFSDVCKELRQILNPFSLNKEFRLVNRALMKERFQEKELCQNLWKLDHEIMHTNAKGSQFPTVKITAFGSKPCKENLIQWVLRDKMLKL